MQTPFIWSCATVSVISAGQLLLFWELSYRNPDSGGVFSPLFFALVLANMAWWVFSASALIFALLRWREVHQRALVPLAILIAPHALPLSDPTRLWLEYNQWTFGSERARFAAALNEGMDISCEPSWLGSECVLTENALLALGGRVYVKRSKTGQQVLFPTSFGIPDGFSGFAYMVHGSDPLTNWPELGLEWAEPWDTDGRVYFVGNR